MQARGEIWLLSWLIDTQSHQVTAVHVNMFSDLSEQPDLLIL